MTPTKAAEPKGSEPEKMNPEWRAAWEAVQTAQEQYDAAVGGVGKLMAEREDLKREIPEASMDLKRSLALRRRLGELAIEIPQARVIVARKRIPLLEAQRALLELEANEARPAVDLAFAAQREAERAFNEAEALWRSRRDTAQQRARDIGNARHEIDRAEHDLREAIGHESLPVVRTRQRVVQ
jgi:hypothetical protein